MKFNVDILFAELIFDNFQFLGCLVSVIVETGDNQILLLN